MNPYTNSIIQWNINGLKTRYTNGELTRLLTFYNPMVICLQHTNYEIPNIKNYSLATNYKRKDPELGTAIYVNNKTTYKVINLNNNLLQATAIELIIDKETTINLFNFYNQPKCQYNLKEIENLIKNRKNLIVTGDFNAHSPMWNTTCLKADHHGKAIERITNRNDLCILNDPESYTYFSRTHGTFSSIDLTITTSEIVHRIEWQVLDDDHTSDHFPILL